MQDVIFNDGVIPILSHVNLIDIDFLRHNQNG